MKENIADFTAQEAVEALDKLQPVSYYWRDDGMKTTRLGFIAEDTPAIAAIPDKKGIIPEHILTILTKAVQEQQRIIQQQQQAISSMRQQRDLKKDIEAAPIGSMSASKWTRVSHLLRKVLQL
jgi:hypothetical protein